MQLSAQLKMARLTEPVKADYPMPGTTRVRKYVDTIEQMSTPHLLPTFPLTGEVSGAKKIKKRAGLGLNPQPKIEGRHF